VDPPDAPEASNWIRGSFDFRPGSTGTQST
jgi:hypothetical protein